MKVAYVLPRYGAQVVGGAEYAIRLFAERLVQTPGWEVEVFTTCALDHLTWENELPPGTEELHGVTIHRFEAAGNRLREEAEASFARRVFEDPSAASVSDGERWVDLQGPTSPELVEAAVASDADVVIFKPYLFYPTVRGTPRVGARSIMHPAAHDEPPLRLAVYRRPFAATGGFVYNTHEERRLVEGRFGVAQTPNLVLGLGVDSPPDGVLEALPPPDLPGLDGRPYLAYLARVEAGKGAVMLARYFALYKQRRPGPLALVLMGPCDDPGPYAHPDIVVTGVVDEDTKWRALRHATALVAPSPHESFCMAVTEAWAAGIPVVVNGRCAVTRGHCLRAGGGLWFDGYLSFEAVLDRLLASPTLRAALAAAGRAHVDARYRWPLLMDRYRAFLEAVATRARGSARTQAPV